MSPTRTGSGRSYKDIKIKDPQEMGENRQSEKTKTVHERKKMDRKLSSSKAISMKKLENLSSTCLFT